MQDLFTNKFPFDGKIKLSVAGVSGNGNKWFPLARKSVFTSMNKVIFQKLYFQLWFPLAEKNRHIKEYCFKWTENRFPLPEMEMFCKNEFLLDEKNYFGRNIWKIKEKRCQ